MQQTGYSGEEPSSLFKVRKIEMITKTFRIPAKLLARLNTVAQRNGISVNRLVVQCCEYALDDISPESEAESVSEKVLL